MVKANKRIASYWINVHASKECGTSPINGAAILSYKGSSTEDPLSTAEAVQQPEAEESNDRVAMTTNPADKCGNPGSLCVTELHSLRKMPSGLGKQKTDVTVRLPINYKLQTSDIVGERFVRSFSKISISNFLLSSFLYIFNNERNDN